MWSFAQSAAPPPALPKGYYVIVGAFAIRENAENYNAALQKKGMQTAYGFLNSKRIYYVYDLLSPDVKVCLKTMRELRKQQEFSDTWVRYINDNMAPVDSADARIERVPEPKVEQPKVAEAKVETPAVTPTAIDSTITDNEEIVMPDKITLGNTEIFLSLYNAQNDHVAEGNVQVVDTDRGRLIEEVPGNSYLILPDPKSKTETLSLICDVVGFRKVQKEINFNKPLEDSVFLEQMGTSIIAHFELIPYQKGDIRALFNVYFYNDAAVMMPESKFELNQLYQMMKLNPNFNIRLHGHSNGNYHGKIIKMGKSGDFFSVREDAVTTIGSAKELSESRAEVIKDWLVSKGIDAARIEVKAWGGKRPLYDKNGANAKKNIRVEVEITKT
jgi:outer membrane protein OmpA-like peptidoglycan-associated protein